MGLKWKATALLVLYLAVMMGVFFFGRASSGNTRIQAEGIYGPPEGQEEIKGNLTITSPQVTLQNTSISGNLYLSSPKEAEGEVWLKNVTVAGSLVVMDTASHLILEDTHLSSFFVKASHGHLQVQARGNSHIGPTRLETGANLKEENLQAGAPGFTDVTLVAARASLFGSFTAVHLKGSGSQLILLGGKVDQLEVAGGMASATLPSLTLFSGTQISTLLLNSPAAISGEGTIAKALVNAPGATFQQAPAEILLAPQVTALVAGKEMAGEDQPETPDENQPETPAEADEKETGEAEIKRPKPPQNLRAAYNEDLKRLTLTWQTGDEELTARYLLTRRQGQGSELNLSISRAHYTDTSLSPGHTYTYYLAAVSPDGHYSPRVQVRITIPMPAAEMVTLEILINPPQGGSVNGAGAYPAGTVVNLTATAAEGFKFSHWENTDANSTDPKITITMTAAKTITAVFREIPAEPPAP